MPYVLSYQQIGKKKVPRLDTTDKTVIVNHIFMNTFTDNIEFIRRNPDGSTYSLFWATDDLACLGRGINGYERLAEMPPKQLVKLARMANRQLGGGKRRLEQITTELKELQTTEKRMVKSKEIKFPDVKSEPLRWTN